MLLLNRVEKHGHIFFKYRGQFPVIIFLFLIPFLYFLPSNISEFHKQVWILISVVLCCLGLLIRFYTIGTTLKGTSPNSSKVYCKFLKSIFISSAISYSTSCIKKALFFWYQVILFHRLYLINRILTQ